MDVLDVLNLCDRFLHSEFLGDHAGEYIGLVLSGQGQEGVEVLYSLVGEQLGIPSVTHHHYHVVRQSFGEDRRPVLVLLKDLHETYLLAQLGSHQFGDLGTAQDHHLVGLHVVLPQELHQELHSLARGDDEHQVVVHEFGVELRHDGLPASGDGDHAELEFVLRRDGGEFRDLHVQQGRVLL